MDLIVTGLIIIKYLKDLNLIKSFAFAGDKYELELSLCSEDDHLIRKSIKCYLE